MELLRDNFDPKDTNGFNLSRLKLLNLVAIFSLGLTLGCLKESQKSKDNIVSLAVCPSNDQIAQNHWAFYQVVTRFGDEQCILLRSSLPSKDGRDILVKYIPQSQMDPNFTLSFKSKGKTISREDF